MVFLPGGRNRFTARERHPARPEPVDAQPAARESRESSSEPASDQDSPAAASSGNETDDAEVMRELADLREEWSLEGAAESWFYTRVLGGKWTKCNKGVVSDGAIACGRSACAEWCKLS